MHFRHEITACVVIRLINKLSLKIFARFVLTTHIHRTTESDFRSYGLLSRLQSKTQEINDLIGRDEGTITALASLNKIEFYYF